MNKKLSLNVKCCDTDDETEQCTPISRFSPLLDHLKDISPAWKNLNAKRINNIYYQLKSNYCLSNNETKSYITKFKKSISKFVKILNAKNQYSKENIQNYIKFYSLYDNTIKNILNHVVINDDLYII